MDGIAAWIIAALVIVSLVAVIWALFSIVGIPKSNWEAAGKSKALWLTLLIVSLFLGFGVLMSLIYLIFVAPKVRSVDYRHGYTAGMGSSSLADLPPDDPRRKAAGL